MIQTQALQPTAGRRAIASPYQVSTSCPPASAADVATISAAAPPPANTSRKGPLLLGAALVLSGAVVVGVGAYAAHVIHQVHAPHIHIPRPGRGCDFGPAPCIPEHHWPRFWTGHEVPSWNSPSAGNPWHIGR